MHIFCRWKTQGEGRKVLNAFKTKTAPFFGPQFSFLFNCPFIETYPSDPLSSKSGPFLDRYLPKTIPFPDHLNPMLSFKCSPSWTTTSKTLPFQDHNPLSSSAIPSIDHNYLILYGLLVLPFTTKTILPILYFGAGWINVWKNGMNTWKLRTTVLVKNGSHSTSPFPSSIPLNKQWQYYVTERYSVLCRWRVTLMRLPDLALGPMKPTPVVAMAVGRFLLCQLRKLKEIRGN